MNRLNKTESALFIYRRFSLFMKDPFFRLFRGRSVSVWSWLNFSPCIDTELIFFHMLVLQEYWVLTESRIPLKPVQGE